MKLIKNIPLTYLADAADILADTNHGLSGAVIVSVLNSFASENDVVIPHSKYPFEAPNKRTALLDNLKCFSASIQYKIIKTLCNHRSLSNKENKEVKPLLTSLISKFSHLAPLEEFSNLNQTLIEETLQWLEIEPKAYELYSQAINKYKRGIFTRNLLDDLRLSLEILLKFILKNNKSLENQLSDVSKFITKSGSSKEISNMISKLIDYYNSYQNKHIKHDDVVIQKDVEFIFEISSLFMRHLIRLHSEN